MNIISDINIFKRAFKAKMDKESLEFIALFNQFNNNFVLSKSYLELIESEVENPDLWKSLFTEMSDGKRVKKVESKNSQPNQICIELNENFKSEPSVIITINNQEINEKCANIDLQLEENIIIKSLLINSSHIIYVHDFKNNAEIEVFFKKIFSFQQNIGEIFVFNREYDLKFLNSLKDKRVYYYTLLKRTYNKVDLISDSKDKSTYNIIGRNLRCYFTFNRSLIHERKIILGNLIVSPDNALVNLNTEEPTWQITIDNNSIISTKWKEKCESFRRLNSF